MLYLYDAEELAGCNKQRTATKPCEAMCISRGDLTHFKDLMAFLKGASVLDLRLDASRCNLALLNLDLPRPDVREQGRRTHQRSDKCKRVVANLFMPYIRQQVIVL